MTRSEHPSGVPRDGRDDPWTEQRDQQASGEAHDSGAPDDPRVQAALDHLQRAAREMIAASRSLLDVAEDLVEDPRSVSRIVDLLGSVGELAHRASARGHGAPPAPRGGPDDESDPPVQRIPVS